MAYRESHFRNCPFCRERMSATAPKCFNCGKFVDGRPQEDEADEPRSRLPLLAGIIGAIVAAGVIAWFLARGG